MTTPEPMTVEDVTRLLHAAVDAYGADWVDPNATSGGCTNTYMIGDLTCHCIAGWVLTNHGHDLTFINGDLSNSLNQLGIPIGRSPGAMSEEAYGLLDYAQDLQDKGTPWGEVVTQALATVGEVV
jgi:hypothetical protein